MTTFLVNKRVASSISTYGGAAMVGGVSRFYPSPTWRCADISIATIVLLFGRSGLDDSMRMPFAEGVEALDKIHPWSAWVRWIVSAV